MPKANQTRERTWAILCHLTALIILFGIPFGNLLGPLVVWLIRRNDFPLVDSEGKESLNFQISMTIYSAIALVLCIIFIGFILIGLIVVADIILVIMASIKTSNGEKYQYPLTIRLIK